MLNGDRNWTVACGDASTTNPSFRQDDGIQCQGGQAERIPRGGVTVPGPGSRRPAGTTAGVERRLQLAVACGDASTTNPSFRQDDGIQCQGGQAERIPRGGVTVPGPGSRRPAGTTADVERRLQLAVACGDVSTTNPSFRQDDGIQCQGGQAERIPRGGVTVPGPGSRRPAGTTANVERRLQLAVACGDVSTTNPSFRQDDGIQCQGGHAERMPQGGVTVLGPGPRRPAGTTVVNAGGEQRTAPMCLSACQ